MLEQALTYCPTLASKHPWPKRNLRFEKRSVNLEGFSISGVPQLDTKFPTSFRELRPNPDEFSQVC